MLRRRAHRIVVTVVANMVLAAGLAGCGPSARTAGAAATGGATASAGATPTVHPPTEPEAAVAAAPGQTGAPSGGPDNPLPPVAGKVMLGEYVDLSGQRSESQSLALREQELGRNPRIVHRFYEWTDNLPRTAELPAGSTLLLSWAGTSYRSILNGSQDKLIARAADAMVAYHQPVFIRWAWEMNGDWYIWGGARNNSDPTGFINAWRHIHDIFAAHHATNVAWVWGPNWNSEPNIPWNDLASYYPGDDYVDWVGVSGYMITGESCDNLFGEVYAKFASRKPIMIAETGAQENDKATKPVRIREFATWVENHPSIAAVVWFDTDTDHGSGKNYRIDSSPATLNAYRQMAQNPYFSG